MKKYNHKERFAITSSENSVEFWHPASSGDNKVKVFANKNGEKSVLASDGGCGWTTSAKKAPYCEYRQIWFAEYPYGSYCWGIRRCLITGKVNVQTLYTEINPRGLTECDTWEQECKSYVPEGVKADFVA